jgi:hypothetical protein
MWNVTALVSYWILNDTSNNRLILYTHENVTYVYYDYYYCEFTYQINWPSLAYLWPTAEGSSFTEEYRWLDFKNPFAINEYYQDLLYIAEYDYCGIDEDTTLTFDGAYTVQKLKAENSTVNGMEIVGMYVVGYAQIDSAENYLLDQGAAYLYQLYDAYAPDGPSLSQIQGFRSGNHNGSDTISFSLHGYNCVYTSRFLDFSPKPYFGSASAFVCGSSSTAYYQSIADVYLYARSWLLNNAEDYPVLDLYWFEQSPTTYWMRDTMLRRQVCYQATLDQIANDTMGAAMDPTWYDSINGAEPWNWNSWYNTIVRPSFYDVAYSSWSSLSIDNYKNSLYMKTVQGYMQNLDQDIIRHNSTFIDVRASAVQSLWVDGEPALRRTITYDAMNGEYYTFEVTHSGDLDGQGLKKFKVEIWKGFQAFQKAIHIIAITMSIYGLVSYVYELYALHCFAIVGTLETPGAFSIASITVNILDSSLIGALKSVGITIAKAVESPVFKFLLGLNGLSAASACALAAVVSAAIIGISVFFIVRAIAMECGASPQMADLIGAIAGFAAATLFLYAVAHSATYAFLAPMLVIPIIGCLIIIGILIVILIYVVLTG